MKLIKLSSNRPSFRSIPFRPQGLTLILGDGAHSSDHQEGDSNGVGKTLALRLIHHCLGAQKPPKAIAADASDWMFHLDVVAGSSTHRIDRSGDGKTIALDERGIKLGELREWLNEHGGFRLPEGSPYSFRSLFSRFARQDSADCVNPVATAGETPSQSLQRTLYLLNANDELARQKEQLKNELDKYRNELKLFNDSPSIRDVFTAGHKPTFRLRELAGQIPKLQEELAQFVVAEDYREMEAETDSITKELRELSGSSSLKEYELAGIREAMTQKSDITKDELLSLYSGLEQIFQPTVLRHFDEVEAFQIALVTNRTERLALEESRVSAELDVFRVRAKSLESKRSELIERMNGKRALEEYASISRNLAALEEERNRLESYVQFDQVTKQKVQAVRTEMVEQDALALQYVQSEPLSALDARYRTLINALYPDATAGIGLFNNDGQNKLRFNLEVVVQGQESDGISNAMVLCFDWLLFTAGRPNQLGFLWHDNRLFADLDPKPRAAWFSEMLRSASLSGRQYIASLNSENFSSMVPNLLAEDVELLRESVVLTLQGDKDSNRLMGVRFG
jgi:uncharacterized protein YydD (DUF2326 family)